jgi:hypothetical protein
LKGCSASVRQVIAIVAVIFLAVILDSYRDWFLRTLATR